MTQQEKLWKFVSFWFSPWGAAKGAIWEALTDDRPFTGAVFNKLCKDIIEGTDDLNWKELESWS